MVTLVLLALNLLGFLYQLLVPANDSGMLIAALFAHWGVAHCIFNLLFLWLFGDNIEDRLGRATLVGCYVGCGMAGNMMQAFLAHDSALPLVGASAAIAGVIGAYFVLLPQAKVLIFVPLPLSLVEIPAVFFLAMFWVLQFLTFVVTPTAVGGQGTPVAAMTSLAVAFGGGMLLSVLRRRPIRW